MFRNKGSPVTKYPENQQTWARASGGRMRYNGGKISAIFMAGETLLLSKCLRFINKKPLKSPKINFFSGING